MVEVLMGLTLLMLVDAPESAQVRIVRYGDDRLVGIQSVDALLTIEGTANPRCAPRKDDLQRTVIDGMRDAGIPATLSLKARSTPYSLETRVRSAEIGRFCATAISSELFAEVDGIPEADKSTPPESWGSLLIGPMGLLREETLVTTAAEAHDAAVRRAVRSHVEAIAARLRRANP